MSDSSESKEPAQSLTPPEQNRQNWEAAVRFFTAIRGAVLHPDRLWRQLVAWPVASAFVLLGIGSGIGVLSMTPPLFLLAKVCFIASAIILWLKITHWLVTSKVARLERMLLAFVIFGISGLLLTEAVKWISRNQSKVLASAPPSLDNRSNLDPAGLRFLEFSIAGISTEIRMKNKGQMRVLPNFGVEVGIFISDPLSANELDELFKNKAPEKRLFFNGDNYIAAGDSIIIPAKYPWAVGPELWKDLQERKKIVYVITQSHWRDQQGGLYQESCTYFTVPDLSKGFLCTAHNGNLQIWVPGE